MLDLNALDTASPLAKYVTLIDAHVDAGLLGGKFKPRRLQGREIELREITERDELLRLAQS